MPLSTSQTNAKGETTAEMVRNGSIPHAPCADPRGEGIMMYDQRRRLQFKIFPSACPQHAQLVRMVRTQGVAGLKAYFKAYVTPARELKIVMDEMLPPQPW